MQVIRQRDRSRVGADVCNHFCGHRRIGLDVVVAFAAAVVASAPLTTLTTFTPALGVAGLAFGTVLVHRGSHGGLVGKGLVLFYRITLATGFLTTFRALTATATTIRARLTRLAGFPRLPLLLARLAVWPTVRTRVGSNLTPRCVAAFTALLTRLAGFAGLARLTCFPAVAHSAFLALAISACFWVAITALVAALTFRTTFLAAVRASVSASFWAAFLTSVRTAFAAISSATAAVAATPVAALTRAFAAAIAGGSA